MIELCESLGVRSYIFVPCIVCKSGILVSPVRLSPHRLQMLPRIHSQDFGPSNCFHWLISLNLDEDGQGEGFGNPISIQTVAIVRAALKAGRIYSVDPGRPVCDTLFAKSLAPMEVGLALIYRYVIFPQTWPVCHVLDNTTLYVALVSSILEGNHPSQKKHGYYLAASGNVAWVDLYQAIGEALVKRGIISDAVVERADERVLDLMAEGLKTPREMVALQLGGA